MAHTLPSIAWWLCSALAAPADGLDIEEIVVVAQRNGWDGVRWRVRSDVHLPGLVTLRSPDGDLAVDAWTLDWVLRCEVKGLRHAACVVEDVSFQVVGATTPQLEAAVDSTQDRLAQQTVHVRFGGDDRLVGVDVVGWTSGDGISHLVELAMDGFAGGMPPA